jgi:hypothetical protein
MCGSLVTLLCLVLVLIMADDIWDVLVFLFAVWFVHLFI